MDKIELRLECIKIVCSTDTYKTTDEIIGASNSLLEYLLDYEQIKTT